MPAVEAAGTVVAQATLPGGRHLLAVSVPEVARVAAAGQFAMLRAGDGLDPYLRRALPFAHISGEVVSFLFAADDPGLAWLARRRLGDPVGLLGPLGRGFELGRGIRHLLLVAAGEPVAPLLALAGQALARQVSVNLAGSETLLAPLVSIIPEAVEWAPAPAGTSWEPPAELLLWADLVAASGPPDELRRLLAAGRGFGAGRVQCYVPAPIACGLGWCGACLTELRRGPRRACTGGPVFDLTDLY